MKGAIAKGSQFGGDMGFTGKATNICSRNIRRIMKKYPKDKILQEKLQEQLDKYK